MEEIKIKSVEQLEKDKEVKSMVVGARSMVQVIAEHPVNSIETNEEAGKMLIEAQKIMKNIEVRRKFFVDPYKAVAKAIDNFFNGAYDPLDNAVKGLRARMGTYATEVERKQKEAEAKILAKEAAGKIKPETAVRQMANVETAPRIVRSEVGSVSYRTDRKLRIIDANLIPREYLVVNERLVETTLKAGKAVPGAELYEVKVPVGRGNGF